MRLQSIFLSLIFATLVASPSALAAEPLEWNFDATHSHVGFKIRHYMVSWVRGQFTDTSGKVTFDANDLSTLSMDIRIKTASIDTRNERRDNHLRSADFFDVEKYPEMRFVSNSAKVLSAGKVSLLGDLTMHGVTKPVTLEVEGIGHVVDLGERGQKTGATATTTLSRKEWGMTFTQALEVGGVTVGDEVHLDIEVELARGGASPRAKKAGD